MATNNFFNPYDYTNEQHLIEDLVVESIRIYGIDVYYITKKLVAVDNILNETSLSYFDGAYHIEMYVKTVDGFQGEGDFLSKFGLQIRDQITFTVAVNTFQKYVTNEAPSITRPREGDIVYFPLNKKFYKTTFVEHESVFYQMGSLQVYDLKCELYEYSNERMETGIEFIDRSFNKYSTTSKNTISELQSTDAIAKNVFYQSDSSEFIDFSEADPFSETFSFSSNTSGT